MVVTDCDVQSTTFKKQGSGNVYHEEPKAQTALGLALLRLSERYLGIDLGYGNFIRDEVERVENIFPSCRF